MMSFSMPDENRFSGKARNFAILAAGMVVLVHSGRMDMPGLANWWNYQLLAWGIATFAVPGFFLISGYFLARHFDEPGWWRRALTTRLRTLLVPYLIWNLLYSCCTFLFLFSSNLSAGKPLLDGFSLDNWCVLCLGLDPFRFPKLIPLWYVRMLLLLVLASPVLWWVIARLRWWTPVVLFPLQIWLCGICDRYGPTTFLFYGGVLSMAGVLYFSIGLLLRRFGVPHVGLLRWRWGWLLLALVLIGAGRGLVLLGFRAWGDSLWVVAIPCLLVAVWQFLPAKSWPEGLVTSAFPVYLLHLFNVQFVEIALPTHTVDWWAYPFRAVVVFAVSLWETSLIRRSPPLARILFGGR